MDWSNNGAWSLKKWQWWSLKKLKPTNKFEKKSKKKRKSPNSRILNLKLQIQTCKAKHKEGREKMNKKMERREVKHFMIGEVDNCYNHHQEP